MEQPEPGKQYEVLGFSRETLTSLGFTQHQLNRLTDEDLARIAASLAKRIPILRNESGLTLDST